MHEWPRLIRVPGGAPDMGRSLAHAEIQRETKADLLGKPLPHKLRLQPLIYDYARVRYTTMQGYIVGVECADAAEVERLLADLQGFFERWVEEARRGKDVADGPPPPPAASDPEVLR